MEWLYCSSWAAGKQTGLLMPHKMKLPQHQFLFGGKGVCLYSQSGNRQKSTFDIHFVMLFHQHNNLDDPFNHRQNSEGVFLFEHSQTEN